VDGVEDYLGSIQASSGCRHPDIFKRIGISSAAMHAFHTVWRQCKLSLGTKLRLYQSCVLSILLYGSESWTLLKEDLRRLESFHLKCQRQILGIKRFDFVKNVEIIAATNLPSLEDTIRCRRNSLFGHVVRLSDRTPAHRALKLAAEVPTLLGAAPAVVRVSPGSSRSVTKPHTTSEPSGQELVIVGMAGRRNRPPLSTRYDDDDDDDDRIIGHKSRYESGTSAAQVNGRLHVCRAADTVADR